jgi:hypothetical protein
MVQKATRIVMRLPAKLAEAIGYRRREWRVTRQPFELCHRRLLISSLITAAALMGAGGALGVLLSRL